MTDFAAFVITFRRTDILAATVRQIFEQDLKPSKLLIVDNDVLGESVAENLRNDGLPVHYISMGHNAGPAGAARFALQQLASEGFSRIYWGDDNDPPVFTDTFSRLIRLLNTSDSVAVAGAVGHHFDPRTGNIIRLSDEELQKTERPIPVDSVAGGMSMIIRADVVQKGILPDERFFFGFEELDFCIAIKNAGYSLAVDPDLYRRCRARAGKLGYKRPVYIRKKETSLVREYYSLRNLLLIASKNKLTRMKLNLYLKWILKLAIGFKFGWNYGYKNAAMILSAFRDFNTGKFGERYSLR